MTLVQMEGVGRWAVIVAARRVTRVWERLQSARMALECYPDDSDLTQTCLNLELELAVAIEDLSVFSVTNKVTLLMVCHL